VFAMEKQDDKKQDSQNKPVDYTTYPEGFNALVASLDFIPDEKRMATMLSLIDNLGRR
jgi:soluble cytochrome b562